MADLITLDRALQQLPSNADTDIVANLITACSASVENYCSRIFTQQSFDELIHGNNSLSLFVSNPPIAAIASVRTNPLPAFYLTNSDSTNMTASAQVVNGGLTLTTVKNATTTTQTFDFGIYSTIASLCTAINGYGNNWTAQISQQFATWSSSDLGANIGAYGCRNLTAPFIVHWYSLSAYQVNASLGEIVSYGGFPAGYNLFRVQYTGGFTTIPEEIQQATAELVQNAYASRKWTPGLSAETLDRYSYTRATEVGFSSLSISSRQALTRYRVPKVGQYIVL